MGTTILGPGSRSSGGSGGGTGSPGPAGPTGPTGPSGPVGATGPSGAAGASGASGPAGATGATGPAGSGGSVDWSNVPGPVTIKGASTSNAKLSIAYTGQGTAEIYQNGPTDLAIKTASGAIHKFGGAGGATFTLASNGTFMLGTGQIIDSTLGTEKININGTNGIKFGPGGVSPDTTFKRSAAGVLTINGNTIGTVIISATEPATKTPGMIWVTP